MASVEARASAGVNPLLRAAMTTLAASRLTSHSHGPGSVSSKSFESNTSVRSGEANRPKLDRWASPDACDDDVAPRRRRQVERHDGRCSAIEREGRGGHPPVAERQQVLEAVRFLGEDDRDRISTGRQLEGAMAASGCALTGLTTDAGSVRDRHPWPRCPRLGIGLALSPRRPRARPAMRSCAGGSWPRCRPRALRRHGVDCSRLRSSCTSLAPGASIVPSGPATTYAIIAMKPRLESPCRCVCGCRRVAAAVQTVMATLPRACPSPTWSIARSASPSG